MNINETWKQLKEEITQCDDNKMAVSILLDKIEYLLSEVERLENESELDRNTINAIQGARILSDAHLEAVTQRCEALGRALKHCRYNSDDRFNACSFCVKFPKTTEDVAFCRECYNEKNLADWQFDETRFSQEEAQQALEDEK